ncbi:MAG: DJ-1/PfpI family protein [Deferribacteraceae bacterium]|jgi:4-methyl-5(b-hydroxyethyl)-thiazole monophosphate biosynthesis|nr:DJ-1/PfpI family protein [Deferribacteraceae bacterium]
MKKVLIIMADGFEEIEAVTVIDLLRRADIDVIIAGLNGKSVTGAHNIVVAADIELKSVLKAEYDMLILPGGGPGTAALAASSDVLELIRRYDSKKTYIAAICAAPTALAKAGIMDGRAVTSYPGTENAFDSKLYKTEAVVISGHIITSRAPGTAADFALTLVKILAGENRAETLAKEIYHNQRR